jgi:hypothetical protein
MSLEPPFSQRAAAVMASLRAMEDVPDAATVVAEIARQGPNPGAKLAERLANGVDPARLGLPAFSFDWFLGALTPFDAVRAEGAAPAELSEAAE